MFPSTRFASMVVWLINKVVEYNLIRYCTSVKKKINSILRIFDHLLIKEATEQEGDERAEVLPQIDNYQIYLTFIGTSL